MMKRDIHQFQLNMPGRDKPAEMDNLYLLFELESFVMVLNIVSHINFKYESLLLPILVLIKLFINLNAFKLANYFEVGGNLNYL